MGESRLLAKLGEYRYMKQLVANGEVYLAPIDAFRKKEEVGGIGDKYENSISYHNPANPIITFKLPGGEDFRLSESSRITYCEHLTDVGVIYCLTALDADVQGISESLEDIKKIGVGYDTMILFLDTPEFLKRIELKLKELGYDVYHGFVRYYPEVGVVHDKLTPFDKRERFAYQKEYRIYVDCDNPKPMTIHLGSLEDIAILVKLPEN